MKKMVLVFALAALALGGSAFAQTPYQNNIGIYFDEAGTNNCAFLPVGSHPAYVVLTKLTAGDVLGWEAKLTYDNLFPSSLGHRGQASRRDMGTLVVADLANGRRRRVFV